MKNVKYFLVGFVGVFLIILGIKTFLLIGFIGIFALLATVSFMDWSGDGDGRQWRSRD